MPNLLYFVRLLATVAIIIAGWLTLNSVTHPLVALVIVFPTAWALLDLALY